MFFLREEVYMGYSLSEFAKIREELSQNKIKYRYTIKYVSDSGYGSSRGRYGSFGIKPGYERLYRVTVHKKDYENARYVLHGK